VSSLCGGARSPPYPLPDALVRRIVPRLVPRASHPLGLPRCQVGRLAAVRGQVVELGSSASKAVDQLAVAFEDRDRPLVTRRPRDRRQEYPDRWDAAALNMHVGGRTLKGGTM